MGVVTRLDFDVGCFGSGLGCGLFEVGFSHWGRSSGSGLGVGLYVAVVGLGFALRMQSEHVERLGGTRSAPIINMKWQGDDGGGCS